MSIQSGILSRLYGDKLGGTGQALVAFTILIVLLLAAFLSYRELCFRTGKESPATITSIVKSSNRQSYIISYLLTVEGKRVTGRTNIPVERKNHYKEGQEVVIEYFTNSTGFSTRIKGTGSMFWPCVFLMSVPVIILLVISLWVTISRNFDQRQQPS